MSAVFEWVFTVSECFMWHVCFQRSDTVDKSRTCDQGVQAWNRFFKPAGFNINVTSIIHRHAELLYGASLKISQKLASEQHAALYRQCNILHPPAVKTQHIQHHTANKPINLNMCLTQMTNTKQSCSYIYIYIQYIYGTFQCVNYFSKITWLFNSFKILNSNHSLWPGGQMWSLITKLAADYF